MKLAILSEAAAEMEAARSYLEAQVPGLGSRFLAELSKALAAITQRPLSFPKLETLADDQPYRRALLLPFRYTIVFEIAGDDVLVVAVAHSSRAPNYWLRRR